MDVTQLPFNKLIGLEAAEADSGFLVSLPEHPQYTNHIGTVHAGAMLSLAEAGSGAFLLREFADHVGFIPVVRQLEARFRKPGTGRISARCIVPLEDIARWTEELAGRGRTSMPIPVEVVDASGTIVMSAVVEWFVSRTPA